MINLISNNLNALKKNPSLVQRIKQSQEIRDLDVLTSKSGLPIPCKTGCQREFTYHSRFDPQREGDKLSRTFPEEGLKIFFGLGGAYQIHPFLGKSTIVIIESNLGHLKRLFQLMDYSRILAREDVYILCEPEAGEINRWLSNNYIPLFDGGINMIPLRAHVEEYNKEYGNYTIEIQKTLEEITSDCSTQKKLGRLWQRNILHNIERAVESPLRLSFSKKFNKAILTAAGPGLSRCRERIINRSNSTLLMTVDTALPTLIQWNIQPDYIVTLDPQFIGYLHFLEKLPPTCRIIADMGCHLPSNIPLEQVDWITGNHPLSNYLLGNKSHLLKMDNRGGNVTHGALDLLIQGNIKTIEVMGADFSYPKGKPYIEGSYFFPWYNRQSSRMNTLETLMTGFVLNQKNIKKKKTSSQNIYTSPKLDHYKNQFILFLESKNLKFTNTKECWLIENNSTLPLEQQNISLFPEEIKEKLVEYKMLIGQIEYSKVKPDPLIATLLPLAYANFEGKNQKTALKYAVEYTLSQINHII